MSKSLKLFLLALAFTVGPVAIPSKAAACSSCHAPKPVYYAPKKAVRVQVKVQVRVTPVKTCGSHCAPRPMYYRPVKKSCHSCGHFRRGTIFTGTGLQFRPIQPVRNAGRLVARVGLRTGGAIRGAFRGAFPGRRFI